MKPKRWEEFPAKVRANVLATLECDAQDWDGYERSGEPEDYPGEAKERAAAIRAAIRRLKRKVEP